MRLCGLSSARQFGPLALRSVRDEMVRSGLARTTVQYLHQPHSAGLPLGRVGRAGAPPGSPPLRANSDKNFLRELTTPDTLAHRAIRRVPHHFIVDFSTASGALARARVAMRAVKNRHQVVRAAATLLALLAGALAAPAAVEASGCASPYYLVSSAEISGSLHLDMLADLEALGSEAVQDLPIPTAPDPAPCGSWRCQNAPSTPVPLAPITIARGDSYLIFTVELPAKPGTCEERLAFEASILRPIRVPTSIFHPPR